MICDIPRCTATGLHSVRVQRRGAHPESARLCDKHLEAARAEGLIVEAPEVMAITTTPPAAVAKATQPNDAKRGRAGGAVAPAADPPSPFSPSRNALADLLGLSRDVALHVLLRSAIDTLTAQRERLNASERGAGDGLARIAQIVGMPSDDAAAVERAVRELVDQRAATGRASGRIAGILDAETVALPDVQATAARLMQGLDHVIRCLKTGERRYMNEGTSDVPILIELVRAIDAYATRLEAARADVTIPGREGQVWRQLERLLSGRQTVLRLSHVDDAFRLEVSGPVASVKAADGRFEVSVPRLRAGLVRFLDAADALYRGES